MNALEPDRRPSWQAHAQSRSQTQPSPKALAGRAGAPSTTDTGRWPFHLSTFHQFLKCRPKLWVVGMARCAVPAAERSVRRRNEPPQPYDSARQRQQHGEARAVRQRVCLMLSWVTSDEQGCRRQPAIAFGPVAAGGLNDWMSGVVGWLVRESGRGQPHSRTLRAFGGGRGARSVPERVRSSGAFGGGGLRAWMDESSNSKGQNPRKFQIRNSKVPPQCHPVRPVFGRVAGVPPVVRRSAPLPWQVTPVLIRLGKNAV